MDRQALKLILAKCIKLHDQVWATVDSPEFPRPILMSEYKFLAAYPMTADENIEAVSQEVDWETILLVIDGKPTPEAFELAWQWWKSKDRGYLVCWTDEETRLDWTHKVISSKKEGKQFASPQFARRDFLPSLYFKKNLSAQ